VSATIHRLTPSEAQPSLDALIGRYRNARLLEPRTYGVIVQKRF